MISVIIVEDQSLIRDVIATLLSLEDDISVVATFENGAAALSLGALGFILKESDSRYLIQSLKSVMENKRVIAPELAIMALDATNRVDAARIARQKGWI